MYGCESWTIKKAEYRRIDAFELWCWRRLLRVPWTARFSRQEYWSGVPLPSPILPLDAAKSLLWCLAGRSYVGLVLFHISFQKHNLA